MMIEAIGQMASGVLKFFFFGGVAMAICYAMLPDKNAPPKMTMEQFIRKNVDCEKPSDWKVRDLCGRSIDSHLSPVDYVAFELGIYRAMGARGTLTPYTKWLVDNFPGLIRE